MGVQKLWDILEPVKRSVHYTAITTLNDAKTKCPDHVFVLGIDAMSWLYHQTPNLAPQMTLFQRLSRLYTMGVKAIFVFDGPGKPAVKRNNETYRFEKRSALEITFRQLIKYFGYKIWEAAGEAEAECAKLLEHQSVDLVVTDDVDVLLFGAQKMITNWHQEYVSYFDMATIEKELGIDRDGLVLIGLLAGNDYTPAGTRHIGLYTAVGLAKAGLAPKILHAKTHKELEDARLALISELKTNASGKLGRKRPSAVNAISEDFPDANIIKLLCQPACRIGFTATPDEILELNKFEEPDLTELAAYFQVTFQYSMQHVVETFASLVFPGYVLQCVRNEMKFDSSNTKDKPQSPAVKSPATLKSRSQITDFFAVSKKALSTEGIKDRTSQEPESIHTSNIICINRERQPNDTKTCHVKEYQVQIDPACMLRFKALIEKKLDPNLQESTQARWETEHNSSQADVGHACELSASQDTLKTPSPPLNFQGSQYDQDDHHVSQTPLPSGWQYANANRSIIPQTPRSKAIKSTIIRGENNPELQSIKCWSKTVNRQWINAELIEATYPQAVREYLDKRSTQTSRKRSKARVNPGMAKGQQKITQMLLGVQKSDGTIELEHHAESGVVRHETSDNPFVVDSDSQQSNPRDNVFLPSRRVVHKRIACNVPLSSSSPSRNKTRHIVNLDSDSGDEASPLTAIANQNDIHANLI
ncbi:hypothetical protein INT43_001134 [Umbelopsis isabellina]|uniref:XPG-I domain-containing protein n=1 Tax=Mortierella isabellina TaxID=91625 RepID=A0A8H7PK38_MORIS|nr:hypothetical protein INT43_001134 [Umbelopsis isabellina]